MIYGHIIHKHPQIIFFFKKEKEILLMHVVRQNPSTQEVVRHPQINTIQI